MSVLVQLDGRADGLPSRVAHGVPAAAERRLGARRVPAPARCGATSSPAIKRVVQAGVRAPPQDARELARAGGLRTAQPSTRRSAATGDRSAECAPRRSSPTTFVDLAASARVIAALREDQPRPRRRPGPRADGCTSSPTVMQRIDLADGIELREAEPARRSTASRDTLVRSALAAARRGRRASRRAGACASRSGSRSRPGSAAAAPTPRRRSSPRTRRCPSRSPRERLAELAAAVGSDVPVLPRARPAARRGGGRAADAARAAAGLRDRPRRAATAQAKKSTGEVFASLRRRRRAGRVTRSAAPRSTPRSPRETWPRCRRTTSPVQPRDARPELLEAGAFRADLSGAGPAVYGLFADREQRRDRRRRARSRRRRSGSRSRSGSFEPCPPCR